MIERDAEIDPAKIEEKIRNTKTRNVYKATRPASVLTVVSILPVGGVLWAWMELGVFAYWALFVAVNGIYAEYILRGFKQKNHPDSSLAKWIYAYDGMMVFQAVAYSSICWLFWVENDIVNNVVCILIQLGAIITYVGGAAGFPRAFWIAATPIILSLLAKLASSNEPSLWAMAVWIIIFFLFSIGVVSRNNQATTNSLRLQFENEELAKRLEIEKLNAEVAERAKSQFLATASHDLRQPVHAQGLLFSALLHRLADTDFVQSPANRKILDRLKSTTESISSLIESILDISRLDAGIVQPDIKQHDLSKIFSSLEAQFSVKAEMKNLTLKFVDTSLAVESDSILLERVLGNLISNAIRYTNKGGVLVGCRRQPDHVNVQVYDTGQGIPQDKITEIFAEFSQLSGNQKSGEQGLGLGLSIVERLCRVMNCRIGVSSVTGKGSVFTVELKRASLPSLSPDLAHSKPNQIRSIEARILVIDDDSNILESLETLLGDWGYNFVGACSAEDALDRVEAENGIPDLIISDYRLGGGDVGTDVVERLNRKIGMVLPAMIITADTSVAPLQEVRRKGFRLLHKPLAPEELKEAILVTLSNSD